MADDISVKLAVEGEQNFKTAISAANAQLKAMDAELQEAVSSMTGMESAEQKLAAKAGILNQQIEKNKEKLSILSQQYEKSKAKLDELGQALEKAKAEHGDNSAEATKAANAYNRQAQEVAKLEKDIANTNTAINKETAELNQLNNTLEQTGERWHEAGEKISDAGEKITSVGSTLTKAVTAPLVAAGTAAVKFASDYEENLNKVDASFKDSAEEVKAWAKTATQQFGMSESAALEATSLFGDMGTSMGLTTKEAANMSTELAGLAGDLSSFKNIDIDQAMTALKGVFTGETESLKTLGVVMTETNLKAFAEDMGLVYDSMSQAEKVTLRYKYVLANTTNAQGDYARTSDGTANSIRTLKAEASNLASAFGQELLPQVTPLIQKATELVRGFGELDEGTKQSIIQAGLLAAATGPVVTGVGKITEGVGFAIEKVGTLSAALSGGGGLASALTTTLGTGGAAGLAIAGVAALTAVGVGLGTAIYNATEPVVQIKKHLENLAEAQDHLSDAENITELCTRYEELRDKTEDTSLSSEEISAVQAELAEVRAALNDATNGAISAEGEYDDALDETVGIQKELAEAEKNRANQEIYTQLVKGANDYQKSLQKQKDKQYEISIAEERVERGTERLSAAVEQYSAEMSASGKATFSTKLEMDDAATCANGARKSYDALVAELSEMQAATTEYEQSLISLVQDGFLSAADAAALLGISEDALGRRMTAYWNETHQASTGTQALAGEHLEAAQAAQEQAAAEQEATSAIWDIASAAVDARTSGKDLRAAYEELSGQLEKVRDDGDETAIMWAEQKLAALDLVATNQELSQSFATMGVDVGDSLSYISAYLIDAGIDADTYASGVASMRDSVINSYKAIVDENSITLEEMKAAQEANLKTTQQWGADLESAWQQAYAAQDTQVMAYINYLYDLGPEYAVAVHEMMQGGYEELQSNAESWAESGELSVRLFSERQWANQYLAELSGEGIGNAALAGMKSVDQTPGAQEAVDQIVGNLGANKGVVENAMASLGEGAASAYKNTKSVAQAATDTVTTGMIERIRASYNNMKSTGAGLVTYLNAGVATKLSASRDVSRYVADAIKSAIETYNQGMKTTGAGLITYLNAGIASNASGSRSAARAVAEAAKAAAGSVSFYGVGYNMAAGVASGIYGGSYLINNAAYAAAKNALYTAKSALGIHSPSTEFRDQVGAMIPAGIALGVEDETGQVVSAMKRLGETALNSINSSISMPIVQRVEQPAGAASNRNVNCSINVQVYQQPGQDANEFADIMIAKVERSVRQRGMGLS